MVEAQAHGGARRPPPERVGKTIASAYSVRPKPGAPVSTPLQLGRADGSRAAARLLHAGRPRPGVEAGRSLRTGAAREAGSRPCPAELALAHGSRPAFVSPARTFALWARFAAWSSASDSGEVTAPSVGWFGVRACAASTPNCFAEHRCERLDLHLAEPRKSADPLLQIRAVARLGPDARRVAPVLLRHDGGELADTVGHRAREPVNRRLLGERRPEVHCGELPRIERAHPFPEDVRPCKSLGDGHLLVDREADEQREGVGGEKLACLGIIGEVQCGRHQFDASRSTVPRVGPRPATRLRGWTR